MVLDRRSNGGRHFAKLACTQNVSDQINEIIASVRLKIQEVVKNVLRYIHGIREETLYLHKDKR